MDSFQLKISDRAPSDWAATQLFERLARHLGVDLQRGDMPVMFGRLEWADGTYALMHCGDGPNDRDGDPIGCAYIFQASKDPQCKLILKQQVSSWRPPKVVPWTYLPRHPNLYAELRPELLAVRKVEPGLYFRGLDQCGRTSALAEVSRVMAGAIINAGGRLPYADYLRELACHRLALALPGNGDLCHREIEAFGVGMPVLMPRARFVLHNDLVSNYHYIAAKPGQLMQRYHEVVGDNDFLSYVARNALKWFNENAAFPACLALTARLLGLDHGAH